MLINFLLYK